MASQADSTTGEPDPIRELTQKLRDMGVSDEALVAITAHTFEAQTKIAAQMARRFHDGPVTMARLGDELSYLTLRLQGLGVAMLGLAGEHTNDPYIEGVCQMVTDIEDNAHRLCATFDALRHEQSAKP